MQVSAGNILSQTTPLSVLTLRAAPIREVAAPAAPAPPPTAVVITVLHRLPGRVRLRVAGLYRNPAQKERIERHIVRQPGIRVVSANILTGTVLIQCDPAIGVEEVQARVVRILAGVDEPGQAQVQRPWHTMSVEDVAQILDTSPGQGLDPAVARRRLNEAGANVLPEIRRRSTFGMLIAQFSSLPVALLGVSAILSIATGGVADGVVILSVGLINAGIGFLPKTGRRKPSPVSAVAQNRLRAWFVRALNITCQAKNSSLAMSLFCNAACRRLPMRA